MWNLPFYAAIARVLLIIIRLTWCLFIKRPTLQERSNLGERQNKLTLFLCIRWQILTPRLGDKLDEVHVICTHFSLRRSLIRLITNVPKGEIITASRPHLPFRQTVGSRNNKDPLELAGVASKTPLIRALFP